MPKSVTKKRKCKICGTPFVPPHHLSTLCSRECVKISQERSLKKHRRMTRPEPVKPCEICGKTLSLVLKGRSRKYHGDAKTVGSCAWKALQAAIDRQKQRREEAKKAKLLQETQ